ncbi:unnamed protein product, partial [Prorocentrum cordatum]
MGHVGLVFGNEVNHDDTLLECGSDDEDAIGSDDAGAMFDDLQREQGENIAACRAGPSFDQMLAMAAAAAGGAQGQRLIGDGRTSTPTKNGEHSQDGQNVEGGPAKLSQRRRWGAGSEASDDGAVRDGKLGSGKKGKKAGSGAASAALALKNGGGKAPARAAKATGVGGGGGGGGGAATGPKRRGRPEKDLSEIVSSLMSQLEHADESSIFFNENATVQLKCIRRYLATANIKVAAAAPDALRDCEILKKKLHVIESCMVLWNSWAGKSNMAAGRATFHRQWVALETFTEAEPRVSLSCEFISLLYYNVMASAYGDNFATELTFSKLRLRFPSAREEALANYQRRFTAEAIGSVLNSDTMDTLAVVESLAKLFRQFTSAGVAGFSPDLLNQIGQFQTLVDMKSQWLGDGAMANVDEVIA